MLCEPLLYTPQVGWDKAGSEGKCVRAYSLSARVRLRRLASESPVQIHFLDPNIHNLSTRHMVCEVLKLEWTKKF